MKIAWLLRGSDWRTFHVHCCRECRRKFCDDEPGCWTDYRYDEFPELCSGYFCKQLGRTRHHGANCRSRGPFCPACAAWVERELTELRAAYRD
jgi:hypothetical protein